jgi:hypothetical protein
LVAKYAEIFIKRKGCVTYLETEMVLEYLYWIIVDYHHFNVFRAGKSITRYGFNPANTILLLSYIKTI